ncbi:MAG: CotH kinase family protein [Prolixibacteraceae bacterium]|jgi:hypothetical protein|nr:CotH kinase family protein [Prolixibacteraceae bacterium]
MLRTTAKLILLYLFIGIHASGQLVINEIVTSNNSFVFFDDDTPDLIEIYNTGNNVIRMIDYCLTNDPDNLCLWSFPDTALIHPKSFLLLFADKKNSLGGFHINFNLDTMGGFIALTNKGTGKVIDSFEYGEQQADISYGHMPDGCSLLKYMNKATPGQSNNEGFQELLSVPEFSHPRGLYDSSFDLTITSQNPNGKIVYTLDGSEPLDEVNGTTLEYSTPLCITTTSCIRAKVIDAISTSNNTVTQTFIFPAEVIQQPISPEGFPTNWGHSGKGDYEMDPHVVNDPDYSNQMIDIFYQMPTVSLVMNQNDLFGEEGIYIRGENIEKPVSAEYIILRNSLDFQVNCGVIIFGGSSTIRWKSDKLSMRLKFKSEYGPSKLNVPLYGSNNSVEFNTLVLDAGNNNSWHYGGQRHLSRFPYSQRAVAQYTRDQYTADLQNAMDGYSQHGFYVHLYLNGLYWGIYNLHERPDENFAATYLGGTPGDYDILKHSANGIVNGDNDNYLDVFKIAEKTSDPDLIFKGIEKKLDIPDFINYMILNYYIGNTDWDSQNWYASFNRKNANGKWRFHCWDNEHIMEQKDNSIIENINQYGPTHLHQLLMKSESYKQYFADAVQKLFYSTGVLTPQNSHKYYENRVQNIVGPIIAESARWGDNRRFKPYTRDKEWETERNWIENKFLPNRRDYVIDQFRDAGWFPLVDAPLLKVNGKEVSSPYFLQGDKLELQCNEGIIYYTFNGIDPKSSGGKVDQRAFEYESQHTLNDTIHLTARTYLNGEWSAKVDLQLLPHNGIVIDEIYYHGMEWENYSKDSLEFITLKNISTNTIDLSNARFAEGIFFTFPEGTEIRPNSTLTLASNAKAFQSCYKIAPFCQFEGELDDLGEKLLLLDKTNTVLLDVTYSNIYPWPNKTDGNGYALKYIYPAINKNVNDPINWTTKAVQASIIDQPRNRNGETIALISYPNPAQNRVNLTFYLNLDSQVELSIFNYQGKLISLIAEGNYSAGQHSINLDLLSYHIPSGIYLVCLKTEKELVNNKLIVIE